MHYLDKFLTAGQANSNACHHNLSTIRSLWQAIGETIKEENVEGPTTRLTFLGINRTLCQWKLAFQLKARHFC